MAAINTVRMLSCCRTQLARGAARVAGNSPTRPAFYVHAQTERNLSLCPSLKAIDVSKDSKSIEIAKAREAAKAVKDNPALKNEPTIFTKIINKEIPATIVYEDKLSLAFEDVDPQAPCHVLVIPKKQIAMLSDIEEQDKDVC